MTSIARRPPSPPMMAATPIPTPEDPIVSVILAIRKKETDMGIIDTTLRILAAEPGLTLTYDPPVEPQRDGTAVSLSDSSLHPDVKTFLQTSYPEGLYQHQHEAVEAVLRGRHTVVATRTSSGKSLIYSLPVFDALARDTGATALFLFPQKALANDQQLKLQEMAARISGIQSLASSSPLLVSRYDGSTPQDVRKQVRSTAQIVLTNPDMLHMGILQHHSNWEHFFRNLKVVVIDECHEYRGVFGTNVAFILRRLRQVSRMYGSTPRFIATSATVRSPESHMHQLTGLDFVCIGPEQDTSRQGPRKFWMVRGEDHFYDTARKLGRALSDSGLTALVFCPTRVSAERMIARAVRPDDLKRDAIRVYRSGLSPTEREQIERGLRSKDVRLVFSTSALELGIDIGAIDVVICVGLPHTMMSLWQRAGRSARGGREGATIFVPADTPIDTYYARHPDALFARDSEPLFLNLHNLRIASQHYACAVQEGGGEEIISNDDELGAELARVQELRKAGKLDHEIFYCTDPHVEVNIRNGGGRSFELKCDDHDVGEIDHFHLLRECYVNAIYRHGGKSFRVLNVLYGQKLIRLRKEFSRNETSPHIQRKIRLKKQFRTADFGGVRVATVTLDVTEYLIAVSEKDPSGQVVMSWQGSLGMRQYRLPTEGVMLALSEDFLNDRLPQLGANAEATLCASERLLASLFPTIAGPCDTQDYSSGVDRLSSGEHAIFLYDTVYDGVDLTSVAFDHMPELVAKAIDRVASCECASDNGCFQCVANPVASEQASKSATLSLLQAIRSLFLEKTPVIRETARELDAELADREPVLCVGCQHILAAGAKFCSECGTKVEA